MRGPASTLSACAHVHTHYKKAQWCMFGGSTPHEEEAEGGMFSPAVLKEWDIMVMSTAWKLQLLDTCSGAIGVLQTMSHTSL